MVHDVTGSRRAAAPAAPPTAGAAGVSSSPALRRKHVSSHASWSRRSPPRPRPENVRPRVGISRTAAMNSARSRANAADSARVRVGRHGAGQPRLHRPRQRIPLARLAQRDRLRGGGTGSARPARPAAFASASSVRRDHARVPGFEREPGRVAVADAEDRVDRPGPGDRPDRQRPPLRKLPVDQRPRHRGRDVQLVVMHPHTARVAETLADPWLRPREMIGEMEHASCWTATARSRP